MTDDLELAAKLIEVERAQIGHELHDGVIPLLFAASAVVGNVCDKLNQGGVDVPSTVDRVDLVPKLEQLTIWLNEAMQTSRRLLTGVYPPELDGREWTAVVAESLERLFPDSEESIRWDMDPRVNEVETGVACAAYRIVIEAVRNACRHGNATEVVVSGSKTADSIEVTIRDDGKGFDPKQVTENHFGLRSMRGRAELVRGTLLVDSQEGGPTVVTFKVPMVAAAR